MTETNNHYKEEGSLRNIKIVVVGDGAVGKTCLCSVFAKRIFPTAYEPTIFENYSSKLSIDGENIDMQIWDTAGQESFDKIRTIGYTNASCFILCFSVVDLISFKNVKNVWIQELRDHEPKAHILLVGTKSDLRGQPISNDQLKLNSDHQRFSEVSRKTIFNLIRRQKLSGYVEASALNGVEDVDKVFHEAARIVIGKSNILKNSEQFCHIL